MMIFQQETVFNQETIYKAKENIFLQSKKVLKLNYLDSKWNKIFAQNPCQQKKIIGLPKTTILYSTLGIFRTKNI